jgi:hypothetical protein
MIPLHAVLIMLGGEGVRRLLSLVGVEKSV